MVRQLFAPARITVPDAELVKKAANKASGKFNYTGTGSVLDRIRLICDQVQAKLGKYKDDFLLIRDEKELEEYINTGISNNYIVIDTETMGLDPISDDIVGLCLYTWGKKPAYVPINHISFVTKQLLPGQVGRKFVSEQLQKLVDREVFSDFFNAQFDIRVVRHSLGVSINPGWCGYVAAKLLDENNNSSGLKALHSKYIAQKPRDKDDFKALFDSIPCNLVPIETFYLYAARDAIITSELCEFQRQYLTVDHPLCIANGLQDVARVMREIEIPLITEFANMSDRGLGLDLELQADLSEKYHKKLEEPINEFYSLCAPYQQQIDAARASGAKLDNPINIGSTDQIAILLYDIMGIVPPKLKGKRGKSESKRGTGEPILEAINIPICKCILRYRGYIKLLNTYIDKFPKILGADGKIHGKFNQVGTVTGRTSSSDPNMQNIPAKNKDIRKLFIPSPGNVFISADYSSQEMRIAAHLCRDESLIRAFKEGKQIYSEIASVAFGVPYEECLETLPNGKVYPDGKKRRGQAKAVVLGVMYGKGIEAIAEDMKVSKARAQEVYSTIMGAFPKLESLMLESQQMARDYGYVTTMFGRKRRLPDMQLPMYYCSYDPTKNPYFDPLDFDNDFSSPPPELVEKYTGALAHAHNYKQKRNIIDAAAAEGLKIRDNGAKIAEATRQCLNSRVQGSAADQVKIAMRKIATDDECKKLGLFLVLNVHDELIAECPIENAAAASARMKYIMEQAIADVLIVPAECDVEIMDRWNGESISA